MRTGTGGGGHSNNVSSDLREDKHQSSGTTRTVTTVVSGIDGGPALQRKNSLLRWNDQAEPREQARDHDETSEGGVTDASSAALWCEICEEGGHDILTCVNMFDTAASAPKQPPFNRRTSRNGRDVAREGLRRSQHYDRNDVQYTPEPLALTTLKNSNGPGEAAVSQPPQTALPHRPVSMVVDRLRSPVTEKQVLNPTANAPAWGPTAAKGGGEIIEGTGAQAGMYAGKTSGVIDPDRWCALCERDGHDSVDCPVEDAF